ncbi:MAG TPA: hypothetical protein VEC13_03000 [Candidatus Paceibacterota bacterium]|nr:hypothetical protein [Candidatus Paceibacterota bacterium]
MTNRKLIIVCCSIILGLFILITLFLFVQSVRDNKAEDLKREQFVNQLLREKAYVPKATEEYLEYSVKDEASGAKYFNEKPGPRNTSNVVRYIASGAFIVYIPLWMSDNWYSKSESLDEPNADVTVFYPNGDYDTHDFTKIKITTKPSHELFNAYTLYQDHLSFYKGNVLTEEMIMNKEQTMRIYHVEMEFEDTIEDTYYLDGKGKTAIIEFGSSIENNHIYGPKVKEFVTSFVSG